MASREPRDVLPTIEHLWLRVYGEPQYIVSDQEGALFSDEGSDWADKWNIELRANPKGAHAYVIERRNELLRQQYHKIRTQCQKDGVKFTQKQMLDEAILACNCLISVHGTTPYEAVYG